MEYTHPIAQKRSDKVGHIVWWQREIPTLAQKMGERGAPGALKI